eukprot:gnl/TRDRNA2_/TRDRNA2_156754_c0_seq1.p1 gnl/TRDRNA2_/TRDRNA2_156754_c0~~gnl/TRDRNA2_/TRDRNA2_156754_c0_seq1.p1  ORF type:complete len:509 (-),score=40.81 gnl/TRDRNA2_/TRDRNA2_156754_c0_seq1:135-1661(-)
MHGTYVFAFGLALLYSCGCVCARLQQNVHCQHSDEVSLLQKSLLGPTGNHHGGTVGMPRHFTTRRHTTRTVGTWHCIANGSIGNGTAKFSSVQVLDLDGNLASLKKQLQNAQLSGQPVLLRHGGKSGTSHHRPDASRVIGNLKFKLKPDAMERFNASNYEWGGMRDGKRMDMKRIAQAIGGKRFMSFLEKKQRMKFTGEEILNLVQSGKTDGFYFHISTGTKSNSTREKILQNLGDPFLRYPLFQGDTLEYSNLFVQPKMFGGTHIDDLDGATYFYLHLLQGRKLMRLWPFYDHDEIAAWGCLQKKWDRISTPPELFLRGAYAKGGFASNHWGSRGFENSILRRRAEEYFDFDEFCDHMTKRHPHNTHAGRCFVDVELQAGEEIFVPSGIPHQLTTLEPSVALSANYRFSAMHDEVNPEQVKRLAQLMGIDFGLDYSGKIGDIEDVRNAILNHTKDTFDVGKWRKYYHEHHASGWLENISGNSSERYKLVTSAILSLFQEEDHARINL